jgi:hypothetical protein
LLSGQNLVPNPSFENTTGCLSDGAPGTIALAVPWTGPVCSPDLFQYCAILPGHELPNTFVGQVEPVTGSAIAGAYIYALGDSLGTLNSLAFESLQVPLLDTLISDSFYRVEINVAAGIMNNEFYTLFIDRVGLHFTDRPLVYFDNVCRTFVEADTLFTLGNDLETPPGMILDTPGQWRKFCWVYRARGYESQLLLGQFAPPETVSFQSVIPAWFGNAKSGYYFFDDISVTPLSILAADPLAADTVLLCPDVDSIQLSVRSGFDNMTWSTGAVSQSITVSDTGWYRVTTPLEDCGEIIDSVYVTSLPDASDLLEAEVIGVCANDFAITIRSAFDLSWPDGTTGRSFQPLTAGSYPVEYVTVCGNELRDTVVVVVDTLPFVDLPDTLVICPEDLGDVSLLAPANLITYQWSNGTAGPETTITQAGLLVFDGEHPCGRLADSTLVVVPSLDLPNEWPDTIFACRGETVALELPAAFMNGWDDGFLERYREITESGRYTATLNHVCGSLEWSTTVVFSEPPVLDLPNSLDMRWGDSLPFSSWYAGFPPLDVVAFSPAGDSTFFDPDAFFRPTVSGTYGIRLRGVGSCEVEGTFSVVLDRQQRFYLPNAFSPNFDGINDWIELFPGPAVRSVRNISIYDRWGGRIYEQPEVLLNSRTLLWNGQLSNGNTVQNGVYLLTFEITYFDGSLERVSEDFVVVR